MVVKVMVDKVGGLMGKTREVRSGGWKRLHHHHLATTRSRVGCICCKVEAREGWQDLVQVLELRVFRVPRGLGKLVRVDGYLGKGKMLVSFWIWWWGPWQKFMT